jgi:hypothetical protein
VNVQHDCYSCRCTGIQHSAVQQERDKTSRTQDLIDHNPEPRFVLNVHSIHNYKSILAVTPPGLQKPFTSVDVDVVTLRKRAAQLIRKECTDDDIAHPEDPDELTSGSLPFDRTHGKTQAAPHLDLNATFTGTLSSQSKLELLTMAAVLGIQTTEKDRKQELTSKIRDHLDTNPNTRNSAQFGRLTWRSANRSKMSSSSAVPTPPSRTPHGMATTHQQMSSFIPSHTLFIPFGTQQLPYSVAGLPAMGYPVPSTSSQLSSLNYTPLTTHAPYLFPPSHAPPVGGQHNWQGHFPPDIQPHTHTHGPEPGSVTNQEHHPRS